MVAAMLGAWLLSTVSVLPVIGRYEFMGKVHEITAITLIVGLIIAVFSCLEFVPTFATLSFDQKFMLVGGLLSVFIP